MSTTDTLSINAHHVFQILLVLVAKVFQQLCVGNQVVVLLDSPRLGVNFRVVYRVLALQVSEIRAPVAFDHMEGVAMRAAAWNNRLSIVETRCIDYQRVAVPFSDGISPPSGIGIFGKFAPIHENLPKTVVELVQKHRHSLKPKDL